MLLRRFDPSAPPPLTLADVQRLENAHEPVAAMGAMAQLLPRMPRDPRALEVLDRLFVASCDPLSGEPDPLQAGPASRIVITLQEAMRDRSPTAADYGRLGEMSLMAGLNRNAATALRNAYGLDSDAESFRLPLALALLRTDRLEELLQSVHPMQTEDPRRRSQLFVLRGRAEVSLGQIDAARADLTAAIAADPRNLDALSRLGLLEVSHDNVDAASPMLEQARAIDPDAAPTLRLAAEQAFERGDYVASADFYRRMVAHGAPATFEPLPPSLGLARGLIYQGDLAGAKAALDASKLPAQEPHVRYFRALLAYRAGEFRRASELSEGLGATLQKVPSLDLLIGGAMLAIGYPETAARHLRHYVSLVPNNAGARALLDLIEARLAKPDDHAPVAPGPLYAAFGFPPLPPGQAKP